MRQLTGLKWQRGDLKLDVGSKLESIQLAAFANYPCLINGEKSLSTLNQAKTSASIKAEIPILALKQQHNEIAHEIEQKVLAVLRSGNYILGEYVNKLEAEIHKLCNCQYGIAVANGTDALILACWAF